MIVCSKFRLQKCVIFREIMGGIDKEIKRFNVYLKDVDKKVNTLWEPINQLQEKKQRIDITLEKVFLGIGITDNR
jgi:hypothetical protein